MKKTHQRFREDEKRPKIRTQMTQTMVGYSRLHTHLSLVTYWYMPVYGTWYLVCTVRILTTIN